MYTHPSNLLEFTRRDFLRDIDPRTLRKAEDVPQPSYLGITKDYVTIWAVPSASSNGNYIVRIKLLEYPDLEDEQDLSTAEKFRLAIDGDIAISCTCKAFRFFGYEYILTQLDANLGPDQDIFPSVRNPDLEGTLCKHAYTAVKYMGRMWLKVEKDIDEGNFIVDNYESW